MGVSPNSVGCKPRRPKQPSAEKEMLWLTGFEDIEQQGLRTIHGQKLTQDRGSYDLLLSQDLDPVHHQRGSVSYSGSEAEEPHLWTE